MRYQLSSAYDLALVWDSRSDRITDAILLGIPHSEHSAQAEMLDMQEVTGSSPVSPTKSSS